jgi:hypothetical protein
MNKAIDQAIKDRAPFTAVSIIDGRYQAWGVFNPVVQDRKTGLYYNPQEAFDAMMNKPEIEAVFKRLAIR